MWKLENRMFSNRKQKKQEAREGIPWLLLLNFKDDKNTNKRINLNRKNKKE